MIYPNKPFYVVEYFGLGKEGDFGSFGFNIGLDPHVAKRFYEREIKKGELDSMDEYGKRIVGKIFDLKKRSVDTPYHFLGNKRRRSTLLLQRCSVVGNACGLGIDGRNLDRIAKWDERTMKRFIEYGPHNIETLNQASALFTIWNEWAIIAYSLTHK